MELFLIEITAVGGTGGVGSSTGNRPECPILIGIENVHHDRKCNHDVAAILGDRCSNKVGQIHSEWCILVATGGHQCQRSGQVRIFREEVRSIPGQSRSIYYLSNVRWRHEWNSLVFGNQSNECAYLSVSASTEIGKRPNSKWPSATRANLSNLFFVSLVAELGPIIGRTKYCQWSGPLEARIVYSRSFGHSVDPVRLSQSQWAHPRLSRHSNGAWRDQKLEKLIDSQFELLYRIRNHQCRSGLFALERTELNWMSLAENTADGNHPPWPYTNHGLLTTTDQRIHCLQTNETDAGRSRWCRKNEFSARISTITFEYATNGHWWNRHRQMESAATRRRRLSRIQCLGLRWTVGLLSYSSGNLSIDACSFGWPILSA